MASPFFSSYWNQPSESRYSPSSIPLKRKPETASPKVISIPVHFVGSENNRVNSGLNRSGSALKIQKVFRGFLLRKSVSKIVSIKNEVEEIERRIGTVELIRKDSKERLRINETLMALLFKLDSVRGIDSGVRELRKGVIRKAIALQEKVDALVVHPPHSIKSDGGQIVVHHPLRGDDEVPIENQVESMDLLNDDQEECNTMNSKTEIQKEDEDMEEETGDVTRGDNDKMMREEAGEKNSNEELQTQMIRMMSELVEKNEMQTRMINSLTHRVGQLEKALLCDKLRRTNKKKKRQHDAAADGKQQ
ncbi:BAG domain-containing protein [Heracleum sosnowskyi]|uniref:BAG domain-containing protein n=1 Tax=Heracleum sosnowskyi TaxID=360622 RepID=A0AAD8GRW2_9APIA|nr:BAG domain-containing protein [Heracleum sosnowskyi]